MVLKIPYVTVEPYVFLFTFGKTLINEILLPQILLDTTCRIQFNTRVCDNINSPLFKKEEYLVQKDSAFWLSAIQSFQAGFCLVTVLLLGPFADLVGSRKAMFLTPVCTGIQYIIYVLLTSVGYPFHPGLFLVVVPFVALCGHTTGMFLFANAYTAATTSEKNRTFKIIILGAVYATAMCLSSFVSGHILERFGFIGGFVICLILSVLNGIYILFFVEDPCQSHNKKETQDMHEDDFQPEDISQNTSNDALQSMTHQEKESLKKTDCNLNNNGRSETYNDTQMTKLIDVTEIRKEENDQSIDMTIIQTPVTDPNVSTGRKVKVFFISVNPVTKFKYLVQLLKEENQSQAVIVLLIAASASKLSWAFLQILVLFLQSHPFHFDSRNIGYLFATNNLLTAVLGGLVMNFVFKRCFVSKDMLAITITLTSHAIYLILLGISTAKVTIYVIQIIGAIGALDNTIVHSALTKQGNSSTHGTILAVSSTLEQLSVVLASLTTPVIYAKFLELHHGAAFFYLAIFPVLSGIITGIYIFKGRRKHETSNSLCKVNESQSHAES